MAFRVSKIRDGEKYFVADFGPIVPALDYLAMVLGEEVKENHGLQFVIQVVVDKVA